MKLLNSFFNQTRKPEGLLGRFLLMSMNPGHAKLADWGMERLMDVEPTEIVDIGCGGGRNAGELLKRYPNANVTAVDYSPLSVEKATVYNKAAIAQGRCTVRQGDVSALTLDAGLYDLATAFETIYFWPGLERCFEQVTKLLKPGGHFLIVNESDGRDATGQRFEGIVDGMKVYTPEQIEAALKAADFDEITITHHETKPWISVLAKKHMEG